MHCKACENPFTTYEDPVLHINCGHTTCRRCAYGYYNKDYEGCKICLQKNIESKEISINNKTVVNTYIGDLVKEEIKNSPFMNILKFIADSCIKKIEAMCRNHKRPVIGYNVEKEVFVCHICSDYNRNFFSIKEIIDEKMNMLQHKKNYYSQINSIKKELEKHKLSYTKLNEAIVTKSLSSKINERLKIILAGTAPKLSNKVYVIVDSNICINKNKMNELTVLQEQIIQIDNDLRNNVEINKNICNNIINKAYKLEDTFETEFRFKKTPNPEKILYLYEVYKEIKIKFSFHLKFMFIRCLTKILESGVDKEHENRINNILKEEYEAAKN